MTKHTELPWEIIKLSGGGGRIIIVTTKADGVSDICEINTGLLEAEANARLIESAPKMLEACKFVLDDRSKLKDGRISSDCIMKLSIAIQNAEYQESAVSK